MTLNCAGGKAGVVESFYRLEEPREAHHLQFNELAGARLSGYPKIYFDAWCKKSSGLEIESGIEITYLGYTSLEIKKSESLELKLNGEKTYLSRKSSHVQSDTFDIVIVERAYYPANISLLNEIAKTKKVRVRIFGKDRILKRFFNKENAKSFRELYAKCSDIADN